MAKRTVEVLREGYVRGDSKEGDVVQVDITDEEMKLLTERGVAKEMKAQPVDAEFTDLTDDEKRLIRDYRSGGTVTDVGVVTEVTVEEAVEPVVEATEARSTDTKSTRKGK